MTRTIEIPIPDDLLRPVDVPSRESGLRREDYIRAVLSREVTGPPAFSEILKPFRDEVNDSGLTDEDLAGLFSAARDESFREKNR